MVRESLSRDETVEIRRSWNDRIDLEKVGAEYVRKGPATAKPQGESKPALQSGLKREQRGIEDRGMESLVDLSKDFAF